jgi:hypothetical protein
MDKKTKHNYRFTVVGRYTSPVMGNEPVVTINLVAGKDSHTTYCGTLTMAESDWDTFFDALKYSLRDAVEVHDPRHVLGSE